MINVAYHHWKIESYFGDGHRWGVEIGYSFEGVREHGEIRHGPWGCWWHAPHSRFQRFL